MSQGPVRRDSDIVSDEGFSVAENDRVGVERRIRHPQICGEGGPTVSRLSIEDIYQVVLGIEPPIIEVDADDSTGHRHPRKEVVVRSRVIVHSDRLAPSKTAVKAATGQNFCVSTLIVRPSHVHVTIRIVRGRGGIAIDPEVAISRGIGQRKVW